MENTDSNFVNVNVLKFQQLTTSALIDAYHNESSLWDTGRNASEEEKELARSRISTMFNTRTGMCNFSTFFSTDA